MEGYNTDHVGSSDNCSYDSNSDVGEGGTLRRSRYVRFNPNDPIPMFHIEQVITGPRQFKDAIDNFAVLSKYDLVYTRNNGVMVRERRRKNPACPWHVHASCDNDSGRFMVKTYVSEHKCNQVF